MPNDRPCIQCSGHFLTSIKGSSLGNQNNDRPSRRDLSQTERLTCDDKGSGIQSQHRMITPGGITSEVMSVVWAQATFTRRHSTAATIALESPQPPAAQNYVTAVWIATPPPPPLCYCFFGDIFQKVKMFSICISREDEAAPLFLSLDRRRWSDD